jgi:hypothetical protein
MRITLLTFFFIVSVMITARARLSETADQLVARYGQQLKETDQKGDGDKSPSADVIFQKGGFQVEVTLADGISVAESFKKINGEALSLEEVRTLLNANSQGHEWAAPQIVDGEKLWIRDDSAAARLAQDGSSLIIKSKELMSKEAEAKKLEHHPSLDGF